MTRLSFLILLLISSFTFAKNSGAPAYSPPTLNFSDPLPENLFVELARVINPAVVNISTSFLPKGSNLGRRDPMLELLEQFYGHPLFPPGGPNGPSGPQQKSLGTGFVIREDGLIITNNHVIEGADIINVQLDESAKETYVAKLIGSDKRTDIALVKIDVKRKLPVAVLGSSKDLKVGEWVAAFGNPYGHGHTLTKGILSSKGREIGEINKFPLLQTDASINPGNSGGPLVNTKGFVIGVNSAIDARAQGIGFAIPIDDVKSILPQLEETGSIKKGYLGAGLGDLDPQAAESLGLEGGALIVSLDRNGPAAKSGFKLYDIVTEFNGKKVKSSLDLIDAVGDSPIGKKVEAKLHRESKSLKLQVLIANRPEEKKLQSTAKSSDSLGEGEQAPYNIGFTVADITDGMRERYGFPEDLENPMITGILAGSLAHRSGLIVGDIILDVNGRDVKTAKDVKKQIKKGTNTFRIVRGNRIIVVIFET